MIIELPDDKRISDDDYYRGCRFGMRFTVYFFANAQI